MNHRALTIRKTKTDIALAIAVAKTVWDNGICFLAIRFLHEGPIEIALKGAYLAGSIHALTCEVCILGLEGEREAESDGMDGMHGTDGMK